MSGGDSTEVLGISVSNSVFWPNNFNKFLRKISYKYFDYQINRYRILETNNTLILNVE